MVEDFSARDIRASEIGMLVFLVIMGNRLPSHENTGAYGFIVLMNSK
jgi:hypothetical protein